MAATTLADHPDYRITLHQPDSVTLPDKIVVTFDGQPSDLGDRGFGSDLCQSHGWAQIYVAQRHGTQYQGLEIDHFFEVVAPHCEGKDVACYGSSLGGYAAFYYGGCLDARIIAAAPMFPAWPRFRNKAYLDLTITHVDLSEAPRSTKSPVVIVDPHREFDMMMVEEMIRPCYPNVRLVEVPYGGHTVLITLSKARVVKPLITRLIEADEIMDFERPAEGTAVWHAERGRALIKTDPDAALQELEKSLAIFAATQPYCQVLNILLRKGDVAAVQARVDAAKASGDSRLKVVPSLAPKLRAAGVNID